MFCQQGSISVAMGLHNCTTNKQLQGGMQFWNNDNKYFLITFEMTDFLKKLI